MPGWHGRASVSTNQVAGDSIYQVGMGLDVSGLYGTVYARLARDSMGQYMPGQNGSVHARLARDSICQVGMGLEVLGLNGTAYARLAWVSTCGAGMGQLMPGR